MEACNSQWELGMVFKQEKMGCTCSLLSSFKDKLDQYINSKASCALHKRARVHSELKSLIVDQGPSLIINKVSSLR